MFDTSQCIVEFPPEELDFSKWQRLVDMMAQMYESSSGVIVQYRQGVFNVVSTSSNVDNFLAKNVNWPWEMKSFCRRIMETKDKLYVNDAEASDEWCCVPPVQEGPVRSYLGFPLFWPDGSLFGSFCVIDTKPTNYSDALIDALQQLKLIVESELKHTWDGLKIRSMLADRISAGELNSHDKPELELVKRALQLQESINTATLASLMDVVIRTDHKGSILSANQSVVLMFGYSNTDLIGVNINTLLHEIEESYSENKQHYGLIDTLQAKHKDGHLFYVQRTVTSINVAGQSQFIYLISDITDKIQNQEILKQLALYDGLTECANRHLLAERFKYEVARSARDSSTFSLAFIDLDNFKPINDSFGHETGDMVLKEVAKRLKQSVRGHDLVVRYGGDEFIVLLSNKISESIINQKLNNALSHPISYQDQTLTISGSIGVATYPEHGDTLEILISHADKKMYKNKAQVKGNRGT